MTKHTVRDDVWASAIEAALRGDSFTLEQFKSGLLMADEIPSDRTIRDTLNTMADMGWLRKDSPKSHYWHPGTKTHSYVHKSDLQGKT
jgi:hypothetical protein